MLNPFKRLQGFKLKERKHASEDPAKDRILINALMDNISDNIYFKDIDSRFIRINKALANYFKLNDPAEAIGKTDFYFFSGEHARQAYNDEQLIIKTGTSIKREEKETWAKKPDSWVSTVKMPLYDENRKLVGTFGMSRNITDLMLAEIALKDKNAKINAQNEEYKKINDELQRLNKELSIARLQAEMNDRLKTAFLQNMSHEVRTPLNAIVGFSDLILEHYDNKPNLEEYVKIINQHCFDLLDLINDILDVAKIESGQLNVNPEEFDLNKFFSEILIFFKEYQKSLKKAHIDLNLRTNGDLSNLVIFSDKTKMKQIFINLISNAFKFTEKGKIEYGYSLNENKEPEFFVSDTGIGIPPDKMTFIFERFTQVDQGNERIYGGTGLGLNIVKGLINLLKGEIWVESEPGKGSIFYFSFPDIIVTNNRK